MFGKHLKKKAQFKSGTNGGVIVENNARYRIDSEFGRFTFKTYSVARDGDIIFDTSKDIFPTIGNTEWYRTDGFNEIALKLTTLMSYSETAEILNRIRWQDEGGTPSRTLENIVKIDGKQLDGDIFKTTTKILEANNFNINGTPKSSEEVFGLKKEKAKMDETFVITAIKEINSTLPEKLQVSTENVGFYENIDKTVNISIDDVGVKKQKEHRTEMQSEEKKKYVYSTIAHVEQNGKQYYINADSTTAIIPRLIAFLINNNLKKCYFQFFVDGARELQNNILLGFSFLLSFSIILDWFHLEEKCRVELSLSAKGATIRNQILKEVTEFLWYGHIDKAIEYLNLLDESLLKKEHTIKRLIGYFERNRANIPCYALRKHLGLRNSSNKVEKANDLAVAKRQKHNGMSWSEKGSHSLASIKVLHLNKEQKQWIRDGSYPFKFVA